MRRKIKNKAQIKRRPTKIKSISKNSDKEKQTNEIKKEYSLEWKLKRKMQVYIITAIILLIQVAIIVLVRGGLRECTREIEMIKNSLPYIGMICGYFLIVYFFELLSKKNRFFELLHLIVSLPEKLLKVVIILTSHFIVPYVAPLEHV